LGLGLVLKTAGFSSPIIKFFKKIKEIYFIC
jgi:hypothetical protein